MTKTPDLKHSLNKLLSAFTFQLSFILSPSLFFHRKKWLCHNCNFKNIYVFAKPSVYLPLLLKYYIHFRLHLLLSFYTNIAIYINVRENCVYAMNSIVLSIIWPISSNLSQETTWYKEEIADISAINIRTATVWKIQLLHIILSASISMTKWSINSNHKSMVI